MNQTVFQALVVCTGALATAALAVAYFRRVRLERPAVGTFNSRDLTILFAFIVVLPAFYLVLPGVVLTGFLVLTFWSAMSIALRPVLAARWRRPLVPALIAADIAVTYTLLGTAHGLVLYWVLTDAAVLVAAVGVSNLYVQGGLTLRPVAMFALALAAYDAFFSLVVPLTPALAQAFEGRPLNASIGFAYHGYTANIGLGDLLLYGMFAAAAAKGFGRRGVVVALATVGLFGALAPSLAPLVTSHFDLGGAGFVVPAQVFFGPAAVAAAAWLRSSERRLPAPPVALRLGPLEVAR
ncbi:MAG TPA: hypothetical protein VFJ85_06170 [Acidimicrobiales bacterium]|nr:hypothetical protein [Acidimicrobiales bacterium]